MRSRGCVCVRARGVRACIYHWRLLSPVATAAVVVVGPLTPTAAAANIYSENGQQKDYVFGRIQSNGRLEEWPTTPGYVNRCDFSGSGCTPPLLPILPIASRPFSYTCLSLLAIYLRVLTTQTLYRKRLADKIAKQIRAQF